MSSKVDIEWGHIKTLTGLLNNDNMEELQSYVVQHKEELKTPILADLLTEIPVQDELMIEYPDLYKAFIEIANSDTSGMGIRGAVRLGAIEDRFNELIANK